MVYITVGSAAYPILEFLEEWGTENFEVRNLSGSGCLWVSLIILYFLYSISVMMIRLPWLTIAFSVNLGNFSCRNSTGYKDICQWYLGGNSSRS